MKKGVKAALLAAVSLSMTATIFAHEEDQRSLFLHLMSPEARAAYEDHRMAHFDDSPVTEEFLRDAVQQIIEEEKDAPVLNYPPPSEKTAGAYLTARRQPVGALTGRIVYTGAGHGFKPNTSGVPWSTDRPFLNSMVEDYGNLDQLAIFANYLLNAGATVVPTRPISRQPNVVNIDSWQTSGTGTRVIYAGSWSLSTGTPSYTVAGGPPGETYRFANATTAAPTSTATYVPNIPQEGYYPVYTWVLDSTNRVNQQYIINHAGGSTEMRVNHRLVGKGWVWLGTYYFDEGANSDSGSVTITNNKASDDPGSVVIADAIRFGNGMGTRTGQGQTSGLPIEEENTISWAFSSQHPTSITSNGNVGAPPRIAAYMNAAPIGQTVYVGFHSNAGGGRGAVGLYNTNTATRTPNQIALATFLGREINENMRQLDVTYFPNYTEWSNRTTHTYADSFGEIRWDTINSEMDATIIEVAFHDSVDDTQYLRDLQARKFLARSTMKGLIRYFNAHGNNGFALPAGQQLSFPPDEPRNLRAANAIDGTNDIVLNWQAPVVINSTFTLTPGAATGAAATSYLVFASTTGKDYQFVAETTSTSYRLTGYNPGDTVFAVVHSSNAGGQSFASNVASARVHNVPTERPPVLIVDGFNRTMNLTAPQTIPTGGKFNIGGSTLARIIPNLINGYSYAIPAGHAVAGASINNTFDYARNNSVIDGTVPLRSGGQNLYDTVIWILGEESTVDVTLNVTERNAVADFISNGGNFIISGSEIGWDLDRAASPNYSTAFFRGTLRAAYVQDSSNNWTVNGVAGSIFNGLTATIENRQFGSTYRVGFPDVLDPINGSQTVLRYGNGLSAATFFDGSALAQGSTLTIGFPFEALINTSTTAPLTMPPPGAMQLMNNALNAFVSGTSVLDWTVMD